MVHHWLINQLNPYFEKTFIHDSYASRVGRGAHFAIQRATNFIRKCSANYSRDCYVLKLDIQGFFIRIDKHILLSSLHDFIKRVYSIQNKAIVLELCQKIIMNDPTENCIMKGKPAHWNDFPKDKSLFHAPKRRGLPIGNLTSQVFANFYMNSFDHYIKHDLGMRYYGRYVDDFILVHEDKAHLTSLIPKIAHYLNDELRLNLHPRKMHLQHYNKGVHFLGVTIKPHRIYIGKRTKGNFYDAITRDNTITCKRKPTKEEQATFLCSMNSYLGFLAHYNTYRLRRRMLKKHISIWWWNLVYVSGGYRKLVPNTKTIK